MSELKKREAETRLKVDQMEAENMRIAAENKKKVLKIFLLLKFIYLQYIYVAGNCGNQAFPEMPRQLQKFYLTYLI